MCGMREGEAYGLVHRPPGLNSVGNEEFRSKAHEYLLLKADTVLYDDPDLRLGDYIQSVARS